MKHELEQRLRRDARAAEHDAPDRVLARVRRRLEREPLPETAQPRASSRPLLLAAAILVAAGGAFFGVSRLAGDGAVVDDSRVPVVAEPTRETAPLPPVLPAFAWPAQGMSFAARAGEPLTREWENMKRDSRSLLQGLERQLPLPTRP